MQYHQTTMGQQVLQDSQPSCQNLMYQPQQFTYQQMPPLINITDQPPDLLKYAPELTLAVANCINSYANQNAAYRFLFNNMAQAGWNHPEWEPIVRFSMGLLWKFMLARQGATPQNLITEAANSAVMYKASFYATQNPVVFNNLDMPTRTDVHQLAQQHEQLRAEFSQMSAAYLEQMRRHTNPAAMQQAYGGLVGNVMAERIAGQHQTQGMLAAMSSAFQPAGGPTIQQQAYGMPGTLGLVQQGPSMDEVREHLLTPGVRQAKRGAVLDAFTNVEDATPREPTPAPTPAAPANNTPKPLWAMDQADTNPDRPTTVIAMTGGETSIQPVAAPVPADRPWEPSTAQLFQPAVDTATAKLEYELITPDNGGAPIVLAMVVKKTEEEMNREDYAVPSFDHSMRHAVRAQMGADPAIKVMNDIDLINSAKETLRTKEDEASSKVLKDFGIELGEIVDRKQLGVVHSMDQAIYEARRRRMAEETQPSVFQVIATTEDRFLFAGDESDAADVAEATTFAQLTSVLSRLMDDRKDRPETMTTLFQLDGYFTNEFNFALGQLLGLGPNIYVDSFRTDSEDMIVGLGEAKGRVYSDALVQSQGALIRRAMGSIGLEQLVNEKDQIVGQELKFTRHLTVTLLAATRHDLGFAYPLVEPFELFDSTHPSLYRFAEQLLDDPTNDGEQFLVTADGSVFGILRSIVGHKPIVIYAVS